MNAKNFFIATAVFESLTALALLMAPALTSSLLLGSSLESSVAMLVGRVAGAALFTIAIACWSARNDVQTHSAKGIMQAMLFYNVALILLLAYGAVTASLMGAGFFPAIIAHIVFGAWSVVCLLRAPVITQSKTH